MIGREAQRLCVDVAAHLARFAVGGAAAELDGVGRLDAAVVRRVQRGAQARLPLRRVALRISRAEARALGRGNAGGGPDTVVATQLAMRRVAVLILRAVVRAGLHADGALRDRDRRAFVTASREPEDCEYQHHGNRKRGYLYECD